MIIKFKILTFGLLLAFLPFNFYLLTFPVYAVDAPSSASLSAELKEKLDNLKKEIASKAAKLKQEVNNKLQDKAYIGSLKSKTGSSITLASQTGAKLITVNQDTVYFNELKPKQKITLGSFTEEAYIAALGDIDDNGVLTARKIILLPQPKVTKNYLWGQILSVSNKLIIVQKRDLSKETVSFAQANIKKGDNEASQKDLDARDFVIITGVQDKNDLFQAEFIYIIPQGGIIKPKKTATSSAQPSPQTKQVASPGAKVIKTATPFPKTR